MNVYMSGVLIVYLVILLLKTSYLNIQHSQACGLQDAAKKTCLMHCI